MTIRSLACVLVASFLSTPLFAQSSPGAPRYTLRPGDTLQLQHRLTPELDQTVTVQPDGYISLSAVGQLRVSGLNVTQVHDLILAKEQTDLKDPELTLVLEDFTHPYVVVVGEVTTPGRFDVRDHMTALSAIMLAGGFTQGAKSGQVIVFRKVNDLIGEVHELKLTTVKKTAQLQQDMDLQPGDMVLVPHDKVTRLQHYMSVSHLTLNSNPSQF